MTPHDCATRGHQWRVFASAYVCLDCETSRIVGLDALLYEKTLESLLRRALTDAVLDAAHEANGFDAIPRNREDHEAMRPVLITAILTAARETGR